MKLRLIDTHCHVHFPAFDANREAVFARMREKGIGAITVGTTLQTSAGAIACAESQEQIWAAVGYHPEHFTNAYHAEGEEDASTYAKEDIARLARSSSKVVAIGETGLDFFRIDADLDPQAARDAQERGLRDHIAIASECDLPLVIHCREAFARLAEIIRDEQQTRKNIRGVIHCFTGTMEEAQALLDLGFFLSFTGIVTFPLKKAQDPYTAIQRVIEQVPLDRLLVETDAPWLAPVPHRGEQNEPTYVEYVAETIARIRGLAPAELAEVTTQNAVRLFRLPL